MSSKNKLALGIESTAHTWSAGIIDFSGNVISLVNDMFIPEKGVSILY
ncbi:unnamed protein product [marine sediment metagenome]|uniref:Gcp-like domain-containing protein n=1 Tax=marine sediment metagenome TaxID=412755 RepID=X1R6R4_9ZZZZ